MAQKILVADDSLTVQKVVSITLASFDYKLVECKDEAKLNEELIIGGESLLLLDLSLTEGKSGYDIAKEVRAKNPKLPIILLLGTFDTVDENTYSSVGINDRIVKPFESSVFIQKIQGILENDGDQDQIDFSNQGSDFINSELEDITPSEDSSFESEDNWIVDSPAPIDKSLSSLNYEDELKDNQSTNALAESLEGWGMNVPAPIGSEISEMEMGLPGVIALGEVLMKEAEKEIVQEIIHVEEEVDHRPTSTFISTEEFNLDNSDEVASEGIVYDLAIEIEESEDDFWAADEPNTPLTMEEEIEEDDEDEEDFIAVPESKGQTPKLVQPLKDPMAYEPIELDHKETRTVNFDQKALVANIIEELKPILDSLVEKHCRETIENVAWQIIPDLAENLIRNEIKEIKEKSH